MTREGRWALLRGIGVSLRLWAVLALIDAFTLGLAGGEAGLGVRGLALMRAAWLGATVALVLGAALAATWVWDGPGEAAWPHRLRAFVVDGGERVQRARVAALLGGLLALLVFALCGYVGAERLIANIVRAHFAAAATVGWLLALGLPCALLAVALQRRLLQGLELLAARSSRAARLASSSLGSVARVLAILGVASLSFGACVAVFAWATLRHLPWGVLGPLCVALPLAAVMCLFAQRQPPVMPRRSVLFALALVWLAAGGASLFVREHDSLVLARQHSVLAAVGYPLAERMLDVDRDGHLAVLGGRDCAAHDGRVHPGALDVPGNGLDEDCSGADLEAAEPLFEGRHDHPLPASVASRPPIYLITVDAFADARMRAPGVMPGLMRWAQHARDFRAAFSQGPSTRLSFPSMFSSRFDSEIKRSLAGKPPFAVEPGQPLLAELLREAGYETHAIVPVMYFMPERWKGMTRGFDSVTYAREGRPRLSHTSGQVTEAALERMDKLVDPRPAFLWVHYFDAHAPHEKPEGSSVASDAEPAIYDAELGFVDGHLVRLLERIEQKHAGQALVIVTGDHGWAADEPRHRVKHYGYDLHTLTLHVPLLIRAPFVQPGVHSGLASTLDLLPTIANLTRMPNALVSRGVSLVPELLQGVTERPQWLVHELYLPERRSTAQDPLTAISLRTPRYDLILEREHGRVLLYDWQSDPSELHDLAASPAHRSARATLEAQLQKVVFSLSQTTDATGAKAR